MALTRARLAARAQAATEGRDLFLQPPAEVLVGPQSMAEILAEVPLELLGPAEVLAEVPLGLPSLVEIL